MEWIEKFDLFLFDLDGLLVNTEQLNFQAYREVFSRRGFDWSWDISRYLQVAHSPRSNFPEEVYRELKGLQDQEPCWPSLYEEKKKIYRKLLLEEEIDLMPGVEPLLRALLQANKKRCVVTHSSQSQVKLIKEKSQILQTIPFWFTRESYDQPKPHPEGYLKAIQQLAAPGDRIIGFEDSMKGFTALQAAGVEYAFLICAPTHPQLQERHEEKGYYCSSLEGVAVQLTSSIG